MASSSTQKPSSSSSSAPAGKFHFDVFLSFRGEDTRYNFTDHLFVNLGRVGINTFRDDQLERGGEIAQELLGTIEGSRCSVIVFSERYADSKWCLDELTKIMECKREMGQIVLPVFYHVDPSDVRKQTRSFGTAFAKHEINVDERKVQRWRAAMIEAGSLSGWHVEDGYESKPIKEIIGHILKRLNPKLLSIEEHIVGMDVHLEELKSLLSIHLDDIRTIGIYGTGGIGKTTIAKMVYNDILCQFNGTSFLEGVKNRSKCHKDQLQLLQELLHGILEGEHLELRSVNDGINIIKGRLGSKKVLVVVDDVDNVDDLDQVQSFLVGSGKWFGPGSRIIITTRDKSLLDDRYGVDASYEAKVLCSKEAIELFSWHAFKVQNIHEEDYVDMSNCVINYAQGLPLAVKVLGSSLHNKTINEWKSALEKLKKNPNKKINDVLRISFDGLDDPQKDVFLDIACFFKGEKDFIMRILDNCAIYDIKVLCDRCLITTSYNTVEMHDLIQQMGWAIIREEYPKDPSKWSRLWDPNDIYDAFSGQKGMKNIETISLDLSKLKKKLFTPRVFSKMERMFSKMKKLRLLKIYYSDRHSLLRKEDKMCLPDGFEFPPNLRYLHWEGLESLPLNFHGENLVAINLKSSNIKELWEDHQFLAELKFLDLSNSQQLMKMPNFLSMPKLEILNFTGCTSFCNLHSSVGAFHEMKFLTELNFSGTRIKELPRSIGYLESLISLRLSGCSNFEKFPEIQGNMKCLKRLNLDNTAIKELPSNIGYLESLEVLSLSGCSNFEKFPEIQGNMKCLKCLHLDNTAIKELPSSIGYLESLQLLNLSDCSNFEKFPEIQGNMKCLKSLYLQNSAIKELPSSIGYLQSLEILDLSRCSNFEKFPEIQGNMKCLKYLYLEYSVIKELPRSKYLESRLSGFSNFEEFPKLLGNMEWIKSQGLEDKHIKNFSSNIKDFYFAEALRNFQRSQGIWNG